MAGSEGLTTDSWGRKNSWGPRQAESLDATERQGRLARDALERVFDVDRFHDFRVPLDRDHGRSLPQTVTAFGGHR